MAIEEKKPEEKKERARARDVGKCWLGLEPWTWKSKVHIGRGDSDQYLWDAWLHGDPSNMRLFFFAFIVTLSRFFCVCACKTSVRDVSKCISIPRPPSPSSSGTTTPSVLKTNAVRTPQLSPLLHHLPPPAAAAMGSYCAKTTKHICYHHRISLSIYLSLHCTTTRKSVRFFKS